MAEYIERMVAIAEACKGCNEEFSDNPCEPPDCSLQRRLFAIHAAAVVEVVRCEKCLFYENVEYYHPTDKNPTKNVCRLFKRQMQPNDFCSYGERRKEDG